MDNYLDLTLPGQDQPLGFDFKEIHMEDCDINYPISMYDLDLSMEVEAMSFWDKNLASASASTSSNCDSSQITLPEVSIGELWDFDSDTASPNTLMSTDRESQMLHSPSPSPLHLLPPLPETQRGQRQKPRKLAKAPSNARPAKEPKLYERDENNTSDKTLKRRIKKAKSSKAYRENVKSRAAQHCLCSVVCKGNEEVHHLLETLLKSIIK